MRSFRDYLSLSFKGVAMGAANVIPGVSGGTIALITGIFEELINSIKSFNLTAAKLLFTGKFKAFIEHINLGFLIAIFLGVGVSIISLAKLFDYLFENHPIYIWAFFFGLILASIYSVAKTISKVTVGVILTFIIGGAIAITITFLTPASENGETWYLFLCGIIAACSMILPGLSGSFILILLGNYQLVMIDAVNKLDIKTLAPVAVGAGIGLLGFSHVLAWVFKKFKNQTISLLSGFILGSLPILWPWKKEIIEVFGTKSKVVGYEWSFPSEFSTEVIFAIGLMIAGIISIWIMEKIANKN
jgi:putative membrane protein